MAVRAEVGDEGNDGYFASVSDLMVGVLFVFILMLTVFALNFRDSEQIERNRYDELVKELKDQQAKVVVAQRQADLAAKEAQRQSTQNQKLTALLREAVLQLDADLRKRQALREQMIRRVASALDKRGVTVSINPEAGILSLSGDILFATGEIDYRAEAAATVQMLASVMAETLPCYAHGAAIDDCPDKAEPVLETVLVEGHTDRQPYRGLSIEQSQARNDELSTQRALRVFKTLRQTAPALDELKNSEGLPLFGVSGYGERRSLGGPFNRDRRIDLRFMLSPRTSDEFAELRSRIEKLLDTAP